MDNPSRPSGSRRRSRIASPVDVRAPAEISASLLTPDFLRLLLVQLSFGLSFSAYFLLPKYLATEFGANARTIGTAAAAPLVAGVLASPAIGAGLDRFGRRSLLLLGAGIGTLTALALSLVTSVGLLFYLVRAAQGIGFALVFNAATALGADRSPASRLGHAMGLLGAASLITNAIGPSLAEYCAHTQGWKPVFVGTAAMSAVTLLLGLGVAEVRPTQESSSPGPTPEGLGMAWTAGVMGAAFGTLMTFTQPHALDRGAERVASFFIGYTVAALLVRVGLGGFTDRVGRRRVARAALVLYGLVTMVTSLVRPGLLGVFGFGFGIAHGLLYPALAALVAERSLPSRRGRALTGFNAAFNAGCGLSLLGSGVLAESVGYGPVFVGVGLITTLSVLALSESGAGFWGHRS